MKDIVQIDKLLKGSCLFKKDITQLKMKPKNKKVDFLVYSLMY